MFEHLKSYIVKESEIDEYKLLLNQTVNSYIAYNHVLGLILQNPLMRLILSPLGLLKKNIVIAHSIKKYEKFIKFLIRQGYTFSTASELNKIRCNKRIAHLRHDMDGDLVSSLECAAMLNKLGVKANFYVLHTADYYGIWKENVFFRNNCVIETLKKIQNLGHEVGLHTDGLGACLTWGVNPIEVIETEIKWLQKMGIAIRGTAPHNSFFVHNASNSAIFKGRPNHDPVTKNVNPEVLEFSQKDGVLFPLNAIDEKLLKLTYEANDIYRDFIDKGFSNLCYTSIHGFDKFMSSFFLNNEKLKSHGAISETKTFKHLKSIDPNVLLYISTHPEYYSAKSLKFLKYQLKQLWNIYGLEVKHFMVDYNHMLFMHYDSLIRQFLIDNTPKLIKKLLKSTFFMGKKIMNSKVGIAFKEKRLFESAFKYFYRKSIRPRIKGVINKKD